MKYWSKTQNRDTHLLRLDPLVFGEIVVNNAALGGALEAECAVVLLAGGQTCNCLERNGRYGRLNVVIRVLTRSTSGRSSTTATQALFTTSRKPKHETSRTEVVVLQADFSVARDIGVPVGEGLEPPVERAVPADGRGEGDTKRASDGHRSL